MHQRIRNASFAIALAAASAVHAQTSLLGKDITVRSIGSQSGNAWSMGTTGFLGTYITVPAGGATVSFALNAAAGASGSGNPHLNLVVADSKFGFDLTSTTAANYNANVFLPAGTHFVRTERSYVAPSAVSSRAAVVNNLTITGATFANNNTAANALAASDTYIANYRKGNANVALRGPGNIPLLPGTQVNVDLKRHAFNFGTAVPGTSGNNVNSYLGNGGTAQQNNYRAMLNQHFNSVVPENAGKWQSNENTRDVNTLTGIDAILNYAQSNNMRARMHNMIWGTQQPGWTTTLLSQAAGGNATAKADLRTEITERTAYYVGTGAPSDRANKYLELDVYNETFHTGQTVAGSYWNVYTPTGVADMYREAKAAAPNVRMFVNDYNIYADGPDKFANFFSQHTEVLRNAGFNAGYGDVVGGIGTQYYPNNTAVDTADPNRFGAPNGAHNAARMMQTIQNFATHDVPVSLTEFGVKSGASQALAAQILSESMRMTFGNAAANGFMMWGFHAENGGGNLFAPAAALFNVNTSNWNAWTITEAGKVWQDLLGIADWDGNANNAWDTNLNVTVNADGSIDFNGFFGDYNIGNQSGFANLLLAKGTNSYALNLAAPPGWRFWNVANSGSFSSSGNWTNGIPGGVGMTAHFGPSAAARDVAIDSAITLSQINFDSASSYTLNGATITLEGPANVAAIYAVAGNHTISAPIVANDNLQIAVTSPTSTLDLAGGIDGGTFSISKLGGGVARIPNLRAAGLSVDEGTVQIAPKISPNSPAGVMVVNTLSVDAGAQLDLTNNAAVVDYSAQSALGDITTMLAGGYNGGAWNGSGISSSSAAAASTAAVKTAIGVAEASDLFSAFPANFAGQSVDGTSVLLMYTVAGDANLSGKTDIGDFSILAANFNEPGRWFTGDFNFDGVVNISDFAALASNFNYGLNDLPRTAVPEPASAIVILASALFSTSRRRRGEGGVA